MPSAAAMASAAGLEIVGGSPLPPAPAAAAASAAGSAASGGALAVPGEASEPQILLVRVKKPAGTPSAASSGGALWDAPARSRSASQNTTAGAGAGAGDSGLGAGAGAGGPASSHGSDPSEPALSAHGDGSGAGGDGNGGDGGDGNDDCVEDDEFMVKRLKVFPELIGKGKFGNVFAAQLNDTLGTLYAVKRVKMTSAMPEATRAKCFNEVTLLQALAHPNIVACLDAFFDRDTEELVIVLEMVEGGDLKELIREMRANRRKFTEKRVWMILESMAAALGYMHSQRILHRDLKSGNVLLGRDARVKVADFGLGRLVEGDGTFAAASKVGTPLYMPPEILRGERYGPKADVYSLGCVMYEVCLFVTPFDQSTSGVKITLMQLFELIKAGRFPPITPQNTGYSAKLCALIMRMLSMVPQQRPSMAELQAIAAEEVVIRKRAVEAAKAATVAQQQQQQQQSAATVPAPRLSAEDKARIREVELGASRRTAGTGQGAAPPVAAATGAVVVGRAVDGLALAIPVAVPTAGAAAAAHQQQHQQQQFAVPAHWAGADLNRTAAPAAAGAGAAAGGPEAALAGQFAQLQLQQQQLQQQQQQYAQAQAQAQYYQQQQLQQQQQYHQQQQQQYQMYGAPAKK
jgi:NIMA (never in mitosis gene a)-related kinase